MLETLERKVSETVRGGVAEPARSLIVDMNGQSINLGEATYGAALALIRKRSGPFGLFGYVYFLEFRDGGHEADHQHDRDVHGYYGLYGGRLEEDQGREQDRYERSRDAINRELQEEIGQTFRMTDFQIICSVLTSREGGRTSGVDVFFIDDDDICRQLTKSAIQRHQRRARIEFEKVSEKAKELTRTGAQGDGVTLEDLETQKCRLKETLTAGPPIKIRHLFGRYWMFGRKNAAFGAPSGAVPWEQMSPLTAYALLAEASYQRAGRR